MLQSNVKFTHANFEYFLMQVGSQHDSEQIKSKLLDFKKLDSPNNVVVLDFDGEVDLDGVSKTVSLVNDLAGELGVQLHGVLKNHALNVTSDIVGVPIIDLPNSTKSNHIYNQTLIYKDPVRSGIKIENDGDIIITNFVSDNAEIVATGNIHVYGVARGRLIAGSAGDKSKRIFVSRFNAQLISIGGVFRTIETKLPINLLHKAVMVSLDDKERLIVTLL